MNILLLGQSNASRLNRFAGSALTDTLKSYGIDANIIGGYKGGTSLLPLKPDYWLDESRNSLYSTAIKRAKNAGDIDAAIWIQGESDARYGGRGADYQQGLSSLFGRLREDLGDIPIYMQPLMLDSPRFNIIRNAQLDYARGDPLTKLVRPNPARLKNIDWAHFTPRSYKIMANKFARRMAKDFSLLWGGLNET